MEEGRREEERMGEEEEKVGEGREEVGYTKGPVCSAVLRYLPKLWGTTGYTSFTHSHHHTWGQEIQGGGDE